MAAPPNSLDPFSWWRDWLSRSEKDWSALLTDLTRDTPVGEGLGRQTQEALHLQRQFAETMAPLLSALNLPSRTDFQALGDRIGRLEDGLAAVQAELHQLRRASLSSRSEAPTRRRKASA
ncbi:MAG: hypothetical protein H7Z19_22660 [Chitinophagaceae bacterium]|nr:hypothetical protein [Rubrivivax sp.]